MIGDDAYPKFNAWVSEHHGIPFFIRASSRPPSAASGASATTPTMRSGPTVPWLSSRRSTKTRAGHGPARPRRPDVDKLLDDGSAGAGGERWRRPSIRCRTSGASSWSAKRAAARRAARRPEPEGLPVSRTSLIRLPLEKRAEVIAVLDKHRRQEPLCPCCRHCELDRDKNDKPWLTSSSLVTRATSSASRAAAAVTPAPTRAAPSCRRIRTAAAMATAAHCWRPPERCSVVADAKLRLLTWAMEHRDAAQVLVTYFRAEAANERHDEETWRSLGRDDLAARCARTALQYERMWSANERRLSFWDAIACWLGAASVVPGRGLNF
jgi:hypothetical protein